MVRWFISVPVWGERCVDVFCATALPALNRAVAPLLAGGLDVRMVVHTDQPERIAAQSAAPVHPRPTPAGLRDFDCLSQSHREALGMACLGDVVVLLTADAVITAGGLAHAAAVLDNPQKFLVMCAAPRAVEGGRIPSTDGCALMRWAWEHRHPLVDDALWPDGRSADLSRLYFAREDSAVTRWALPHPLAVRVDGRRLAFTPTIDANLMQCFHYTEIHLSTNCEELALVELSPRDKDSQRAQKTIAERLAAGELLLPDPLQRWCLGHKIVLAGPGQDCGDDAVVDQIINSGG